MAAPEIIAIGSATQDVFIITKGAHVVRLQTYDDEKTFFAVPYGSKIDVDDMLISTGGGATNTAFTFRRFGLSVAACAKIGDDRSGEIIRARLQEEGVDDSLLVVDGEHRTGYSAILTGFTGERTVLVYRGATLHLRERDLDWDRLRAAKVLYVGALSGETAELYPRLAAFCAQHGILFVANPGSTQFKQGLEACRDIVGKMDLLFLNKDEAYTFTGVEPRRGPHDEREMLRALRDAGAARVVITEGAKGCQAIDQEAYYSVPACRAKVVSTLGAGDAFASACTAAFYKGVPFARALRYGAVNAAGVIGSIGAKRGILDWDEATAGVQECERTAPPD